MIAGVGAGVGLLVHRTGVMATGLSGVLSGIWVTGTMVTLGGNAGGASFGTLVEGAGQSIWSAPAGEGCGAFEVVAVGGITVTLEKMRESVWMTANLLSSSVTNRVGVGWKRALLSAQVAAVAALVEVPIGWGNRGGKTPLFWRCVLRGYMECRRSDIGSGQGRVRGTIH